MPHAWEVDKFRQFDFTAHCIRCKKEITSLNELEEAGDCPHSNRATISLENLPKLEPKICLEEYERTSEDYDYPGA